RRLSAEERRRLLLSLAASLREEGRPLPAPRSFTSAEMQSWIKEDERDLAARELAVLRDADRGDDWAEYAS
ncbi:MAG: hypothetical protein AABM33_17390, partial [Pseudomonadota bacterium]